MKQTITLHSFRRAFEDMNRTNFSYAGLEVLFDGLEELERETGEETELDVIALCCDFSEDTFANIAEQYSIDISFFSDDEDIKETVLYYLRDNTIVIGEVSTDSVIYQKF
jgi:tRNA A37 threonylcarbamoyltransferase TsaD